MTVTRHSSTQRRSAKASTASTASRLQGGGMFRTPVMATFGSAFNFLSLNLVLLLVSVPVITIPLAINAAATTLDQWRRGGEDRVVREFFCTLRSAPPGRTMLLIGGPVAAIAVGLAEAGYFLHGGDLIARVGLGLDLAALVITLTALGYVFLLAARQPRMPAAALWSLCARLALRNLLLTGPLFLAEIAAATALSMADPPLLLAGVPIAALQLMRLTAQLGLRRAGLEALGEDKEAVHG